MCHHASRHAACHNCIGSQSTAQAGTLWDHSCARPYSCMHSRGGLTPPSLHRPTGTYGAAILRSEAIGRSQSHCQGMCNRTRRFVLVKHAQLWKAAAGGVCQMPCHAPHLLLSLPEHAYLVRPAAPSSASLMKLRDTPHTLPSDATKQPCTTPVGGCACHVLLCLADGTQLPIPGAMR